MCNVVVLPEIKKKRNIVVCGFILKVLCIFALFPDFENYLPIREMGKKEKCHLKKEVILYEVLLSDSEESGRYPKSNFWVPGIIRKMSFKVVCLTWRIG